MAMLNNLPALARQIPSRGAVAVPPLVARLSYRRIRDVLLAGFASVLLSVAPASADETAVAAGRNLVAHGPQPGRPGCSSCHLQNGAGQPEVGIPRLAGLTNSYIEMQLGYFAEGSRINAAMAPYAQMLTPTQRAQVAAYYASLPIPPVAAALPIDSALLARGETLLLNGDPSKDLLSCSQCHGVSALGVGDFSPVLAGQSAGYIESKLEQWQSGALRDPSGAYMRAIASHLSATDIKAIATYLASLPDPAEGSK